MAGPIARFKIIFVDNYIQNFLIFYAKARSHNMYSFVPWLILCVVAFCLLQLRVLLLILSRTDGTLVPGGFYRPTLEHGTVLPSCGVCPSVRPSVTLMDCDHIR